MSHVHIWVSEEAPYYAEKFQQLSFATLNPHLYCTVEIGTLVPQNIVSLLRGDNLTTGMNLINT